MNADNPSLDTVTKEEQQQHAQRQDNHQNIDKSDAEENHSTASEGGDFLQQPSNPSEQPAKTSEGDLPDPETISDNEDGEYDRGKIADK